LRDASSSVLRNPGVIDVSVSPERVTAYLANPRNHIVANHKGPVVESSDGPVREGSWFVLAFDQLRARVEYVEFEPARKVTVFVAWSGRFSRGATHRHEYLLTELEEWRTRVQLTAESKAGVIRWGPIVRWMHALAMRRMKGRIEASA
jgi:hypothetical protein